MSLSEKENLEKLIEPVVAARSNPITCNGAAVTDYAQNWKLVDDAGRAIQIYSSNIESTCGRVSNVDLLNDYLYQLREKYFPRIEEGVYEE